MAMKFIDTTGLTHVFSLLKSLVAGGTVTTEGTGAAYTATVPGITALTAGVRFVMIPHTVSTTTTPTLDVNGLGAKRLRQPLTTNTGTVTTATTASWLTANKPVTVRYDGEQWEIDVPRPSASTLYGTVAIANGGTGADNAADARVNLGIQTADGTTTSQNADYAEVGEWADGNTNDEDRIGYFVAVDTATSGSTMVKATSTADVKGVTVTAPAFSGGCSEDKFGTDGDLLKQYDYVAVMGFASVIDNGTCTVNEKCMPADDGTAIPSTNEYGYHVISRIDDTHIMVAVEPGADMLNRIKTAITALQDGTAPMYTYSQTDLTAGSSALETGKMYLVYE